MPLRHQSLYMQILKLALAEKYQEIHDLILADYSEEVRIIAYNSEYFFETLKAEDQKQAFIKAIAVVEDSKNVNTESICFFPYMGSPTTLAHFYREKYSPSTLDWILKNTNAYRYYIREKSYDEYVKNQSLLMQARKARDERIKVETKARRSAKATPKLYNAVRRGDVKAVEALLNQGADVMNAKTLDGEPLIFFARRMAKPEILKLLGINL